MSLMFPEFFGGEGGITTNRVVGKPVLGITFGPQIQVYYLIAFYCFVCTAAMYAFTRTPLGPHAQRGARQPGAGRVHRLQHAAGALPRRSSSPASSPASPAACAAINFEIVTAEIVSAVRSGGYLLFTFLGGATFFFGPIIGAVLMVLGFGAAVRVHQGLAALPRPDLPVHGDVRAGRHRQPDHDERARRRVRQAASALGLVRGADGDGAGDAAPASRR